MNLESILRKINRSFSYEEFKRLISDLVEAKSTSGLEQTAQRIDATKLNAFRINRIEKEFCLNSELINSFKSHCGDYTWLVLAESWCGDMSQNLPLIGLVAKNNLQINLCIILRDENPGVMDNYLTNGSRSIPKLICFDNKTGEELYSWGPRPTGIALEVAKIKQEDPQISHEDFVRRVQLIYAKDRGKSMLNDLKALCSPKLVE